MTFTYGTTPDEAVKAASPADGFGMKLNAEDWKALAAAVNIGIDSHLEAFTQSTFDAKTGKVWIHPSELHILVRRLNEVSENVYADWDNERSSDPAANLRSGILDVIGIEEV